MDSPDRPIEPSDDEVEAAHPEVTRQATSIRMVNRVHISQPPRRRSRGSRTAAVSPTRPPKTSSFEGSVVAATDEGASARIAVTVPSKNEARPSRKVRSLTVCSQARKTTPQRRRALTDTGKGRPASPPSAGDDDALGYHGRGVVRVAPAHTAAPSPDGPLSGLVHRKGLFVGQKA